MYKSLLARGLRVIKRSTFVWISINNLNFIAWCYVLMTKIPFSQVLFVLGWHSRRMRIPYAYGRAESLTLALERVAGVITI